MLIIETDLQEYNKDPHAMRDHYDFDYSKGVRGKFYERLHGKPQLRNPLQRRWIRYFIVDAIADSSQPYLIIPEELRRDLKLRPKDVRLVTTSDGTTKTALYVGPIEVRFDSHVIWAGAVVMGNQVVLGSIVLDSLGLVPLPAPYRFESNHKFKNPLL